MTGPVRVGMMGLGQRGLQHLRELVRLEQAGAARIVALADAFAVNLEPAKLQQHVPGLRLDGVRRTTSFDELLAGGDLDALYICIPPNVHQGEVIRTAQAGVNLFVEKPMSLYLDEAEAMAQAIAEAGILSTVGFQLRYDSPTEAVRDVLVGKRVVMTTYTLHAPLEGHNVKHTPTEVSGGPVNRVWTASRAWSGTTLVEAGIHLLDQWRYWLGDVAWTQATYVPRPPEEVFEGADNPYSYSVQFGFASGALGLMTLSRLRRVYSSFVDHQVLWTEGRITLGADGVTVWHYDGAYPPATPPSEEQVRYTLTPQGETSTYAINQAFIEAVATRDATRIRSPFGDAMNSLAAVLAANVSDALGGERIHLDQLMTEDRFAAYRQR